MTLRDQARPRRTSRTTATSNISDAFLGLMRATGSDGRVDADLANRFLDACSQAGPLDRVTAFWRMLAGHATTPLPPFHRATVEGLASQIQLRDELRVAASEAGAFRTFIVRMAMSMRHLTKGIATRVGGLSALLDIADAVGHGTRALFVRLIERRRIAALIRNSFRDSLPQLAAVLEQAGLDIRYVAALVEHSIPQLGGLESVRSHAPTGPTVGCVLGLDLVLTESGWTLIESNVSVGRTGIRLSLETAPSFPERLLAFAATRSFTHLVLMNNDDSLERQLYVEYRRAADARGITLSVFEEPATVGSSFPGRFRYPSGLSGNTLVVGVRAWPTTPSFLLSDKLASHMVLCRAAGTSGVRTPRLLWDPNEPLPVYERFPNIICKIPGIDGTKGIAVMKAQCLQDVPRLLAKGFSGRPLKARMVGRLERATSSRATLVQEYVPSWLDPREHLSLARTYLLLTPTDCAYLGGNIAWSPVAVPRAVAFGIVADMRPFVVNAGVPGTRLTGIPRDWAEELESTSLAVGRAFRDRLQALLADRVQEQTA